jgi:hypothetical protein
VRWGYLVESYPNASPFRSDARVPRLAGAAGHAILKGMRWRWLVSRKAADQLPTWQFTLLYVCVALLSVVGAAAICVLVLHLPWAGPFGIRRWVVYGVGYTIFFTGFSLLGRHMRMRRRQE